MAQTKAFNGQRDGEELLFVFRRHIIAMRKGFYMLLLPLAVGAMMARAEAFMAGGFARGAGCFSG